MNGIVISDIFPLPKALGKCLYVYEFFSAVNGIVISNIVPLGKFLCFCQFVSAGNRIVIRIVMFHNICLWKCLYICELFSVVNGMAIENVRSHMVFGWKCLKVCTSFSVNILASRIVILGDVFSAQYLMNKIQSTCNCDYLWLLNVMCSRSVILFVCVNIH